MEFKTNWKWKGGPQRLSLFSAKVWRCSENYILYKGFLSKLTAEKAEESGQSAERLSYKE